MTLEDLDKLTSIWGAGKTQDWLLSYGETLLHVGPESLPEVDRRIREWAVAVETEKRRVAYYESLPEGCLRYGRRWDGEDGSEYIGWWLYPASMTDDEVFESMHNAGWEPFGRAIYSDYDCTGKWFSHAAFITRSKSFALVKQRWAMDI